MELRKIQIFTFICGAVLLITTAFVSFNKLKKGFEALQVYNYFKAKEIFEDQLEKEPSGAAYGLSVIYSRDDNPFYHLDSAYKYVVISDSAYVFNTNEKEREQLLELAVDSVAIAKQWQKVDSLLYFRQLQNSVDILFLERFLQEHTSSNYLHKVASQRDSLAFSNAKRMNTAEAYKRFLEGYPSAAQASEAERLYDKRLYEETTASGRIEDFEEFIQKYPQSPFREEAEYKIFEKAAARNRVQDYLDFINHYPDNRYIESAWRKIYALEVASFNPHEIARFSLKYPQYPFSDELKQDFQFATTQYYPVKVNNRWGFIDENGQLMVKPEYEWNENFSDGLAMVSKNGKVGFVDKSGNLVISPQFDDAYSFNGGYAIVETDGKYGIIDRTGEYLIEISLEDAGEFSEGYFYIQLNDKYGYINSRGKVVVSTVYDDATDFRNGLAVVKKDSLYGMIDTLANVVVDFNWDWIEPYEQVNQPIRVKQGELYGLLSPSGDVIVAPQYQALGEFNESKALAAAEDKYGFIDFSGDTIIPFRYDFSQDALQNSYFKNGYARIYQKGKVGIIDSVDNKVLPAIFLNTGHFADLIPATKTGTWGYTNAEVKLVIPYKFQLAEAFEDSTAVVQFDGKFGLIDTAGNYLLEPVYSHIGRLDTSRLLVADSLFGVVNDTGKVIIPLSYNEAEKVSDAVIRFTSAGTVSYYNFVQNRFIWKED